ncbi:MAG TPA: hypothetical protein VK983_04580 [Candidatus Limnocylindrales bacterium]|nr:hypothetical protein [Candidatus Limnocylindrales bacterium]
MDETTYLALLLIGIGVIGLALTLWGLTRIALQCVLYPGLIAGGTSILAFGLGDWFGIIGIGPTKAAVLAALAIVIGILGMVNMLRTLPGRLKSALVSSALIMAGIALLG